MPGCTCTFTTYLYPTCMQGTSDYQTRAGANQPVYCMLASETGAKKERPLDISFRHSDGRLWHWCSRWWVIIIQHLAHHHENKISDLNTPTELARLSLGNGAEQQDSRAPDMNSAGIVAVDITDRFSLAVRSELPPLISSFGKVGFEAGPSWTSSG
jgi:hypothetical protein